MLENDEEELWVDVMQLERACCYAMIKIQEHHPNCFSQNGKWSNKTWIKAKHLKPYYDLVFSVLPGRYRKMFDMDLGRANGNLSVMTARSMMRIVNSWAKPTNNYHNVPGTPPF